jgi:hypothetical protein
MDYTLIVPIGFYTEELDAFMLKPSMNEPHQQRI